MSTPKSKKLAETLLQYSQLSPEDEPIFQRVMAGSRLWQMADAIEAGLPDFKRVYEFYAKVYFNLLRMSIFKGLKGEELYSMMSISFTPFETCVHAAISKLHQQKQSGGTVSLVDLAYEIHNCMIKSLELHTAPLSKQAQK